ncbi:hypothetical protein [uncultured Cardiobacterium sp.]|uniref:hypothetical protein n=1 Tax=uncultured Cardiobacterium sp. TaxID=417619 RepID=UPI00261FF380|nr:hypothetical protein [uncultured Cardiobacterium sp.]
MENEILKISTQTVFTAGIFIFLYGIFMFERPNIKVSVFGAFIIGCCFVIFLGYF